MNLTQPKISIIIPVYNVEKYVKKCIESVINQEYTNLEIIIVNDGSTDNSGDICDYYANKDKRIILIHQENQGLSMARNNGLDIATGEYIGFVDSDDWIAPDMYYMLYDNAVRYNADISMCNFYYIDHNEKKTPYSNENVNVKMLEGVYKIAHNIRLSNNCVWNRLYKRHLFNEIRFPKGKTFEDIFVMHKLIENANKLVLSSQCKYYYLLRENGITLGQFNLSQLDQVEAYMQRHEYISSNYVNLEKTCRKFIFFSLLWVIHRAYLHNSIETNKEGLQKVIDKVRAYDFHDCGLSKEEENLLILIFKDIKLYMMFMSIKRNQ